MPRSESLPRAQGSPAPQPELTGSRSDAGDDPPRVISVGRYALFREIASGGMATVHFGRLMGPAGFSRTVAIKRLHPHFAKDAEFVSMFLDEMRLAARIQHPNVVSMLDVVEEKGELFLVMEYVHGESFAQLIRLAQVRGVHVPPAIASSIVAALLHGLHSAHEARSDGGDPLGIVHRDVSPQNVLVGADGVTRALDFGIATAAVRLQAITRAGQLKGKTPYLAPERIRGLEANRRSDVYGAAVVLWEALTGVRLFDGENDGIVLAKVMASPVSPPSSLAPDIPPALDAITMRGLDRDPDKRFATAREMALELQEKVGLVAPSEIGDWVSTIASEQLASRGRYLAELDGLLRIQPIAKGPEPVLPPGPATSTPPLSADASNTAISNELVASPKRSAAKAALGATILVAGFALGAVGILRQWGAPAPTTETRTHIVAAPPKPTPAEITTATPSQPTEIATATPSQPTAPAPAEPIPAEPTPAEPTPARVIPSPIQANPATPTATRATPKAAPLEKVAESSRVRAPANSVPSTPVARDPCKPPYTIDPKGNKHYKRECMIDGRF